MTDTRPTFPARYMLQRKDGDLWVKVGNGANTPEPLFRRRRRIETIETQAARATPGPRPTYRVWDRLDGVEVPLAGQP